MTQDKQDGAGLPVASADDQEEPTRPARAGRPRWATRGAALVGAAVIATGAGFGVAALVAGGPVPVSSAIPKPASESAVFQEDDDGVGQDNQENILEATAPGMVHIMSGRTSVGTGIVLTPSGKVLTTYQPAAGAQGLAARYVLSATTFKVKLIGEADGLALLQLEGGDGRAFSTVTVGNSATLVASADKAQEAAYHVPGQVLDTALGASGTSRNITFDLGNLVSLNKTVTTDGHSRGGLMESQVQSASPSQIGGPLVDLTGQVVGITVAEAGSGLNVDDYAMPVNTALVIASRIDASAHGS
jgi:S1-C subfamily serine protease